MTSVPRTTTTAPAHRRVRCRRCKTRFTRARPAQVFCTPGCRKRAADARTPQKTASDLGKQASAGGHLGKRSTEFSKSSDQQLSQKTADRAAEAAIRRWQGRKTLNQMSGQDSCRGCGRRVLDQDTGVIYGRSSRGYVVTIGLVRCGKIWFCPECSSSIRRGRTEELKTGALRWLARGGKLAVVVLTARHTRTTRLDQLSAALWGEVQTDKAGDPVLDREGKPRRKPGAYQRMLTSPDFYGRPEAVSRWTRKDGTVGMSVSPARDGIRHRIGYAGMVRASEVTRSQDNGWHPHMNLLVFLGGELDGTPANGVVTGRFEPSSAAKAEWEDWLREFWTETLRKMDPAWAPSKECFTHDCKCQGKGHGVSVTYIDSEDDELLLEYLTKVQDGKTDVPDSVAADVDAVDGAAKETTRGDSKRGRRQSVTPFQLLYRLWDIERAGLDPDAAEGYGSAAECRAWWAEYEAAMAGRRAIEWTRGLRRHVGLAGDDSEQRDQEFAEQGATAAPLTGGVILTADAHGHVSRGDAEMDLEATVKAECYDSAADVVTGLGGRADHVRIATAEELAEAQENLLARMADRREERERQLRIDQAEADQAAADRAALQAAVRRRVAGAVAGLVAKRRDEEQRDE